MLAENCSPGKKLGHCQRGKLGKGNKVFVNAFLPLITFCNHPVKHPKFYEVCQHQNTKITQCEGDMFIGFHTGLHLAALNH